MGCEVSEVSKVSEVSDDKGKSKRQLPHPPPIEGGRGGCPEQNDTLQFFVVGDLARH